MGMKNKIIVCLTIALAICATAVFGIYFLQNKDEAAKISYDETNQTIVFSGVYSNAVSLEDAEITLVEAPTKVQLRFNSKIRDNQIQGEVKVQGETETCFAAIVDNNLGYIKVVSKDDKVYIFNFDSEFDTVKFFNELTK